MREKSEVFAKFKEWKTEVEYMTGRKIGYLRSDNGGIEKINSSSFARKKASQYTLR